MFFFPVAVGLHYVATHLDLFMKPQSFIALTRPFLNCVETLEDASLETIKRIASYSPSSVPYCLTYCQGVSCLQTICVGSGEASHAQDSIIDERTTAVLLRQLLAPVSEVMDFSNHMTDVTTHSVSDEDVSSGSGSIENELQESFSDDSVDEFMKTMADDIFMDREELERRNNTPSLRRIEKSRRRQRNKKKTQSVKKPMWRAQNFRSRCFDVE